MILKSEIVFISNSGSIGGAQKCLLDLIECLPERYHPIVLIPRKGKFELELINKNIEYKVINFRGWWFSKFRIKLVERLINNFLSLIIVLRYLNNRQIKLVYSNTLYSPFGAFLAKLLKTSHIWHIHEFTHLNYIQKFDFGKKLSLRLVDKLSNAVICPSNVSKNDISNYINSNKIFVVNNGIDLNKNLIKNEFNNKYPLKLIIIGSIIDFKGHLDAILLLNRLISNNIETILFILGAGDNNYINKLKDVAKYNRVQDYIQWVGFKENVCDIIKESDILLVCSKHETFGLTILEAMNNYCPVISTRNGGSEEIIIDGYNGLLYNSEDIDSLYKCVLKLQDINCFNSIRENGFNTIIEKYQKRKFGNNIICHIDKYILK